jgi:hypothetical protein
MKATLSILLFLSAFHIYGQVIIKPLEYNPEQAEAYKKKSKYKIQAAGDTITIPFFDDFTTSFITPDSSKWVQNGGTYINHNYAIAPPNFNVATFDGLQENGTPYNTINIYQSGSTDNLTSLPIDLSVLKNGDSLFLRYFWQGAGNGEWPDPVDSLRLQIKNRSGIWKTMWKKTGDSTAFNYQLIRIGDSSQYYYKGFQFRFESFGRRSGAYDVWNVDYIYLDTGRLAKANWAPDISFTGPPTSFLKNYTAMPINQYLANKAGETTDTVWVQLCNLGDRKRGYKIHSTESVLEDIKNNIVFEMTSDTSGLLDSAKVITPLSSYYKKPLNIPYLPDISSIPNTNVERILKYNFTLDHTTTLDPKIGDYYPFTPLPGDSVQSEIDFSLNDSVSGYTDLTDYYAYDDGTAEFGFGVNQVSGKIACRFKLNVLPDTLTHVRIYFPKVGVSKTGEPLTLRIWNYINVGGSEESAIYGQTIPLNHSSDINKFHTYALDYPLIITDSTIYVGYQQSSGSELLTGFDVNTNSNDKIFFNVNNIWSALTDEKGSLMIRPVFRDENILGYKESIPENLLDCGVFPNPSHGELFIEGKVKNVVLYDLAGRFLLEKEFDIYEEVKNLDLSSLSNGFYILHLNNGEAKAVKKIIISR